MALVVLLRGVNVGGHRRFRPTELVKELRGLDVVNIGAAGTFVVRGPVSRAWLRGEIASRLPFDAEVTICDSRELTRLISEDGSARQTVGRDIVHFVSVLSRSPRRVPQLPVDLPDHGKWVVRVLARRGRFVLGMYRRQMKAIGQLGALDRLFGVPVTTRNWNTVRTIARVLEEGRAHTGGGAEESNQGV